ncbi:unnamed protein product [Lactuca saligna]|uniref:Uncharacterized protein n=1 Tax=Lactuca saligna TaxID=75948 RepID=A0AA35Z4L6_LACSI|nr:unnamed protein product [Lactuca saligna]
MLLFVKYKPVGIQALNSSPCSASQHRWWRQKAGSGGGSKRGEDGGWVNSEWMVVAREKTGEFKMMSGNYTSIDNQNVSGSVPVKLLLLFFKCVFITSILDLDPNLFVDTFSKAVSGSSEAQKSSGWFKVFTVAAYQPYFDVDTSDVLERIKDSLLPFGGSFNEKPASNPDL